MNKPISPLLLATVLFVAVVVWLLAGLTAACDGRFVYVLDDPYIHMAMGRNLAEHGVWGVTGDGFTSSSSSPLWTLLLGIVFSFGGARDGWPLALNVLCGVLALVVAARALRDLAPRASAGATLAVLVGVMVLTPLGPLAFTGQEHLLHAALSLAFALEASRVLDDGSRGVGRLVALAVPLVAVRYEGLFLVAVAALLLRVRGRAGAWGVAAAALVPVAAYATVSLAHGWFALPNPILLKGNLADVSRVRTLVSGLLGGDLAAAAPEGVAQAALDLARACGLTALEKLVATPALLMLVIGAVVLGARRPFLLLFVGACLLHMQFARTGWFHRYEAYLVAMGVVAVGAALAEVSPAWRPRRVLLAIALVTPLAQRAAVAVYQVPRAAANVFQQQVQMAEVLAAHYPGACVAVNDVGAVNWFARITCVDFFGLADLEVCRLRMDLAWGREAIERVARERGVRVAVLYDRWFDRESTGGLPDGWQRVARWRIAGNVVNGEDTVSWYAVDPGERTGLVQALRAKRLPRGVAVTWDTVPGR